MKPIVFIGSSAESHNIALAIHNNLIHIADPILWSQGVFELSSTARESLMKYVRQSDYGVFLFSPDDKIEIRNVQQNAVRDNVIYELGLFTGWLGAERCFIVRPRGSKNFRIPTDLLGITVAEYDPVRALEDPIVATGSASGQISSLIHRLGSFSMEDTIISSDDIYDIHPPAFLAKDLEGFWLTKFSFTSSRNRKRFKGIQYDLMKLSKNGNRSLIGKNFNGNNSSGIAYVHELRLRILGNNLIGQWFGRDTSNLGCLQLYIHTRPIIMVGRHIGNAKDNTIQQGNWEWIKINVTVDLDRVPPSNWVLKPIEDLNNYVEECLKKEKILELTNILK